MPSLEEEEKWPGRVSGVGCEAEGDRVDETGPRCGAPGPSADSVLEGFQKRKDMRRYKWYWDLPGGPAVKILSFHCREQRFDPWWGTKILHATWCGQNNNNNKWYMGVFLFF